MNEIEVRVVNRISYAEAIKIIEKTSDASEDMVVDVPQPVVNVYCKTNIPRALKRWILLRSLPQL